MLDRYEQGTCFPATWAASEWLPDGTPFCTGIDDRGTVVHSAAVQITSRMCGQFIAVPTIASCSWDVLTWTATRHGQPCISPSTFKVDRTTLPPGV